MDSKARKRVHFHEGTPPRSVRDIPWDQQQVALLELQCLADVPGIHQKWMGPYWDMHGWRWLSHSISLCLIVDKETFKVDNVPIKVTSQVNAWHGEATHTEKLASVHPTNL